MQRATKQQTTQAQPRNTQQAMVLEKFLEYINESKGK
jgi:hypothetical protein